jgi:hypothetical protein
MDLVHFFFKLETEVKLFHWQTPSYAQHQASDKLHATLLPLIDEFMEVYQAKYGRVHSKEPELKFSIKQRDLQSMIEFLTRCMKYLNSLEEKGIIPSKDTDLLNIRDEMVGTINQTIYLFSFN